MQNNCLIWEYGIQKYYTFSVPSHFYHIILDKNEMIVCTTNVLQKKKL